MDFYQDYLEGCLTFQNPTHINNGNYTLEASNPLGTVAKTVYGHFLVAPDMEGEWIIPARQPLFPLLADELRTGGICQQQFPHNHNWECTRARGY